MLSFPLAIRGRWLALKPLVSGKRSWLAGRPGSVIARVAIAMWLLTGLLSVSPAWHHWFHEDSQSAQHHCLVSKYSDGDFLNAPPPAVLATPLANLVRSIPRSEILQVLAPANLLPPGRAPPLI